jgi:hypothetical protein
MAKLYLTDHLKMGCIGFLEEVSAPQCRLTSVTTESKISKIETILIYLPCYVDYQMAIAQAEKIRALEKLKSPDIKLEIKVVISYNGHELSENEKKQLVRFSDHVNIFPFGISGDINITQGFMTAVKLKADYLWILSANDVIADQFIQTINDCLVKNSDAHLLVGCAPEKTGIRNIDSVFSRAHQDIPFGLISSVIYRTENMAKNFDSAVQLNWTGWGQLAAIEASCIALGELSVALVGETKLHTRSDRTLEDSVAEKKRIRNGYAHSFFGMPVLISILHSNNDEKKKKYLNDWVSGNWYLVNYFLGTSFSLWDSHFASNQAWLRKFAFTSIGEASLFHRLLFRVSRHLNLNSFSSSKLAQRSLAWIKRK